MHRFGKNIRKILLKLKFVYKDPDLYPNFTKKYTDSSEEVANDSMIIKCGKKYRYVSANDYVSYSYGSDYSYSADSHQLESLRQKQSTTLSLTPHGNLYLKWTF